MNHTVAGECPSYRTCHSELHVVSLNKMLTNSPYTGYLKRRDIHLTSLLWGDMSGIINAGWTFSTYTYLPTISALRPIQNDRIFFDKNFKCIFLEWKYTNFDKDFTEVCIMGQIKNIPALVQIMTWRRPGDKQLSEPMMVSLLTYICVTSPQMSLIDRPLGKTRLTAVFNCLC